MVDLIIFRDKYELDGTGYFELSPGKYQGKHWQENSLFIDEDNFLFIEPIFEKNISSYDHYEMNDADKSSWKKIIQDLRAVESALANDCSFECYVNIIGFKCKNGIVNYKPEFKKIKAKLQSFIHTIANWAEDTIKVNSNIAVLGRV